MEEKLLFLIINSSLYMLISIVFIFTDGTTRKGVSRVRKELLKSFAYSMFFFIAFLIIFFLYPAIPDYWKLVGTAASFIATLPIIALIIWLNESIYEDRKRDLFNAGWKETQENNYKNWEQYLIHHTAQVWHPIYGVHDVSKAEKIVKLVEKITKLTSTSPKIE